MDHNEKYITLTIENGVMTTDHVGDTIDRERAIMRVVNKYTGEVKEMSLADGATERSFFDYLDHICSLDEVESIYWASDWAFNCKKRLPVTLLMIYGYIKNPELYPKELATKYDAYIRKNITRLIKVSSSVDGDAASFSSLVDYAFGLGKPTKVALTSILEVIGRRYDLDLDGSDYDVIKQLYKEVEARLTYLYPRYAKNYFAKVAIRTALRAEAMERMKLLALSNDTIQRIKRGVIMVSDQISRGRDPDYIKDSDDVIVKRVPDRDRYFDSLDLSHGGVVWSLRSRFPTHEELRFVKEAEARYKEVDATVYHIHRCRVNDEMILYALLVVMDDDDGGGGWVHAREMTARGLPYCIAPVFGYDGAYEFGLLPVELSEPLYGCLLRRD